MTSILTRPSPAADYKAFPISWPELRCMAGTGWLADKLFNTVWFLPAGLLIGTAAAVYLIVKRFGGRHE